METCYRDAYNAFTTGVISNLGQPKPLSGFKDVSLVHGTANGEGSAWIEMSDGPYSFVYDPSQKAILGKDKYYTDTGAEPDQVYREMEDVMMTMLNKGNLGPWESVITEGTEYYDNPDWEGQPVAQRNALKGGTFIQAYFKDDGEMNNADFYGTDGSVIYGLKELQKQAVGFRFDRDDLRLDRELELADTVAELAARGPSWRRAVGWDEVDESTQKFLRCLQG